MEQEAEVSAAAAGADGSSAAIDLLLAESRAGLERVHPEDLAREMPPVP